MPQTPVLPVVLNSPFHLFFANILYNPKAFRTLSTASVCSQAKKVTFL